MLATSERRPLVRLRGTALAYPVPGPVPGSEVPVLCGIDLDIDPGETVAVIGPSGSGKSSLIAVIGGLERPTGGRAEVIGTDMASVSEAERTRLRRSSIGIVFQAYHLVPAMTAVENVALPLILGRAADAEDRAARMLDAVGLGHRLDHRPAALSGGEQQRVAIARAFVAEPRLILADEPTGNLDQKTGAAISDLMLALARRSGATLLLVTHDQGLAVACSRTLELDAGRIVRDSAQPAEAAQ
ncbi:MAG TPA: ABC transporter ATP-binding protein [Arenibaculum sp.]|nr:ABC transporter ATP-binding protein [Arenibaculum sp.]